MARLAMTPKGKVIAPVAKVMAGSFGSHKKGGLPSQLFLARRFYSDSECWRTATGKHFGRY